ncbi:F-box/FBD/LRR-repeat protein-like protein, partial [Tanacetum coccineum]
MDRISNVPPGVIEIILCLLPTQEAVRTSILSREWRYRWIKIPKLVFEEYKFQVSADGAELPVVEQTHDESSDMKKLMKRHKFLNAICKVLLMHEGPLNEFTLSILPDETYFIGDKCPELDNIIYHLSRKNTVKKLEVDFEFGAYRLPLSLFSLHHLTHLCLQGCEFVHQPTFNGFRSLTSLSFKYIYISKKSLLHLLLNCPLLKTLTLEVSHTYISHSIDTLTIIDLFECLTVIESLSIPFGIFEIFKPIVHGRVPRELPTTLHLKFLYMHDVCFTQKQNDGLSILVLLMKSSPKLEKIEV